MLDQELSLQRVGVIEVDLSSEPLWKMTEIAIVGIVIEVRDMFSAYTIENAPSHGSLARPRPAGHTNHNRLHAFPFSNWPDGCQDQQQCSDDRQYCS
jgi:hypothetical protein